MSYQLLKNNQHGTTLMELMVYLGISSIVTLSLTMFLVRSTDQRIMTNNQQAAQHNARQVIEKITYSLRNAYNVNIEAGGTRAIIYSYYYVDPTNPDNLITVYELSGGKVYYGQDINAIPDHSSMKLLTDEDVDVTAVSFKKISSSLRVNLNVEKGSGESEINSTISFRQQ
jgi:type II secretory pathway pseudopilin PulG